MNELNNIFNQAKQESLTNGERNRLEQNLNRYIRLTTPRRSYFSLAIFQYATIAALILVISTGTMAQAALPGDFLYPVKTDLTEKIGSAFVPGKQPKAARQVALVERRLKEVETIMNENRENNEKQKAALAEARQQLSKNTATARQKIDQLEPNQAAEAVTLMSELEGTIQGHQKILEKLSEPEADSSQEIDEFTAVLTEEASTTVAMRRNKIAAIENDETQLNDATDKTLAAVEKTLAEAEEKLLKMASSSVYAERALEKLIEAEQVFESLTGTSTDSSLQKLSEINTITKEATTLLEADKEATDTQ